MEEEDIKDDADARTEDAGADSNPEVDAALQFSVDVNLDVVIFAGTLRRGEAAKEGSEATPKGVDHLLDRLDEGSELVVDTMMAEEADGEVMEEFPLKKSSTR